VWSTFVQKRSTVVQKQKVIERNERAARVLGGCSVRTDADPSDAAVDTVLGWFRSDATDADHGIERPSPNAAHAAVDAEAAGGVRIASVCALVDECAHQVQPCQRSLHGDEVSDSQHVSFTAKTAAV
jgi:hypothetical protein